jgi:demethylmenaquinone methyltransferase / 2-methoxy-6-polyprenyl-1,4-benzoquinol methylase
VKERRRESEGAPAEREKGIVHFGYSKVPEDQKNKLVKEHFDSIASRYDFMNTILSFGLHYLWKRATVRMLDPLPGDVILDVCGGTADLALLAARRVGTAGRIVVYDINLAMMEAGKQKMASSPPVQNISFIQGDAEAISCADNAFDGVTVGFGIRNLTHMEKGFSEMFRVLKPGGTFVCLEFSRPTDRLFRALYDFYSFAIMPMAGKMLAGSSKAYTYLPESIRVFPLPDRLADILRNIGFTDVEYRRLTNGIAVIHKGRKP